MSAESKVHPVGETVPPPAFAHGANWAATMDTSGSTNPVWRLTAPAPQRYTKLEQNTHADVVVIGAGIAGLQIAYELVVRGRTVVVLEDGAIASGETGRTTAHVTNAFDDHYVEVAKTFGKEGARVVAESHTWAIDRIEEIVKSEDIRCEWKRINGYLIDGRPQGEEGFDDTDMVNEAEAATNAGLKNVRVVEQAPVPGIKTGRATLFPGQGQFQPLHYCIGLADRITRRGGRIYTDTHVAKVHGGSSAYVESSSGHKVTCDHIVEATNVPISNLLSVIDKIEPWRTYAIALKIPVATAGELCLVWDKADIYHYVRRTAFDHEHDLLIVGGEDHKVGFENKLEDLTARFDRLEAWTRERWPSAREVVSKWSGQVIEPSDMVAYIGRNDHDQNNVYICTGDSGNGITHGPIAGKLIADLITGVANPWEHVYSPRRVSKDLGEMVKHNVQIGSQYARLLKSSDVRDIEDLPKCEGAVLCHKLPVPSYTAVYKDEAGNVHKMSALCPHAYGVVAWNQLEKTWDCPVHGSRFDRYGTVINGPANCGLTKKE